MAVAGPLRLNFVDIAILLLVLGAARSGWRRGLVFYVIDLVGFVASVLLAIRFHSYPAVFWELLGWSQRGRRSSGAW